MLHQEIARDVSVAVFAWPSQFVCVSVDRAQDDAIVTAGQATESGEVVVSPEYEMKQQR